MFEKNYESAQNEKIQSKQGLEPQSEMETIIERFYNAVSFNESMTRSIDSTLLRLSKNSCSSESVTADNENKKAEPQCVTDKLFALVNHLERNNNHLSIIAEDFRRIV